MFRIATRFKVFTDQQCLTDGTKSVILVGTYWRAELSLGYCELSSAKLNT